MKTIRKKITVCLMATVLVALVAVGTTGITLNYRSTLMTVEQLMTQTAALAGERVEQELLAYRNVAMDTGRVPSLPPFHSVHPPGFYSLPFLQLGQQLQKRLPLPKQLRQLPSTYQTLASSSYMQ